jgi:hypothetical protein
MAPVSKRRPWAGLIIRGLIIAFLLMDAIMKVMKLPFVIEASAKIGYGESVVFWLGVALLVSTVAYAIPRTSVLGAILLTGYLGGATATHVRIGDPFYFPIVFGVLAWAGLYLSDDRLRALIPLRKR